MKSVLTILLAIMVGWFGHAYWGAPENPKDYKPVVAVAQNGDTLQEIIERAQEIYGDNRDWRIIAHQAKLDNSLERFIYPGQFIILRMEMK